MISKWSPVNETGKFVATISGGMFGTIAAWPIIAFITESIGWVYSFYISAVLVAAFTLLWIFFVYDEPCKHPRITIGEKDYIKERLIGISKTTKVHLAN